MHGKLEHPGGSLSGSVFRRHQLFGCRGGLFLHRHGGGLEQHLFGWQAGCGFT